jgi:hypothetical protein
MPKIETAHYFDSDRRQLWVDNIIGLYDGVGAGLEALTSKKVSRGRGLLTRG